MQPAELLERLTDLILDIEVAHPTRVAIDGFSASGKTKLGDDLVSPIEDPGRPVARATLDNFKRPWRESHLYDRVSGEGYYRNAYNYDLVRRVLLEPLGPGGDLRYRYAHIDPLTQSVLEDAVGVATEDTVLIVDSVFLFRPELDDHWDLRVFIDIDFDQVLERGAGRDLQWEESWEGAAELYRSRYIPSEQIYVAEVDPMRRADVIIDNRDVSNPRIHLKTEAFSSE